MKRKESFENLYTAAKSGHLGSTFEVGLGPTDPMCLEQHVSRRMIGKATSGSTEIEKRAVELTQNEVSALANLHDSEVRLQRLLHGRGVVPVPETTEILHRILDGEKVKVSSTEIDVNFDFAAYVEKELKEAEERAGQTALTTATESSLYSRHRDWFTRAFEEQWENSLQRSIRKQRQQNRETMQQIISVERDPSSGDYLYLSNGREVHRITPADLIAGAGTRLCVPVFDNTTVSWSAEDSPLSSAPPLRYLEMGIR